MMKEYEAMPQLEDVSIALGSFLGVLAFLAIAETELWVTCVFIFIFFIFTMIKILKAVGVIKIK